MNTIWTKESIIELLEKNDAAVKRAIVVIYGFQTEDEQDADDVRYKNCVGFNAFDAPICSSFARQIQDGKYFSYKQLQAARKIMRKYAQQLANVANAKNEKPEVTELIHVEAEERKQINCEASSIVNNACPHCGGHLEDYGGVYSSVNGEEELMYNIVKCTHCKAFGKIWND